jgi:hypothetical protein
MSAMSAMSAIQTGGHSFRSGRSPLINGQIYHAGAIAGNVSSRRQRLRTGPFDRCPIASPRPSSVR